jgi:general secretion pathway protein D
MNQKKSKMMTHYQLSRAMWVCAIVFALAACQNVKPLQALRMPGQTPPLKTTEAGALVLPDANASEEILLGGTAGKIDEIEKTTVGTGQFIKPSTPPAPGARSPLADQEVSFNFEATPVPEVIKTILGDLLQETYVIAPGVGGTVTFATARPIKGEQAMAVLEMLLSWSGAALVKQADHYLVVQTQTAVAGQLAPQVGPLGDARGYGVRAVPLKFISATQMEELLKPYAKQGSVLKADNARSLIVIAGSKSELENYLSVVDTFDVDWMAGMSFGLYTLERVEVKDLMPELEAIFGDANGGAAGAGSSPLAGMVRMLAIERLNAIMVITPQPSYLGQVEKWIKKLDRGGSEGGAKLYVYDVQNVKATDLADRLNEIFNGQSSAPRQRRTTKGDVAPGLGGSTIGSAGIGNAKMAQPTPTPVAQSGGAGGSGQALLGDQELRITAIEDNNALLISASPAQYEVLKSAIKRLDLEPLQVKIEAKLLEVTLTNNLNMGVQWWLERAVNPDLAQVGGGTGGGGGGLPGGSAGGTGGTTGATGTTSSTSTGGLALFPTSANAALRSFSGLGGIVSGAGLGYVFNGRDARALITALQGEGDTKILSSPTLMVLNNKEATINVGQQIAQNSGSVIGVGGASQSLTTFRDTGITLTVTPRVNPGGLVYLEIQQEQSTPGAATDSINNQVPINQKSINTEVAVQSGQTIFLGGLIQENRESSNAGVPGLKNIPILGRLFGASKKNVTRTETLILITPTVVTGGAEKMREVTDEYVRRFKGLEPLIKEGLIPAAPVRKSGGATPASQELLLHQKTPVPQAASVPQAQITPAPQAQIAPAPQSIEAAKTQAPQATAPGQLAQPPHNNLPQNQKEPR